VQTYDGKLHRAQAFVSEPLAKLYHEVRPTEQYMRLLREGSAENYLEPHYQVRRAAARCSPAPGVQQGRPAAGGRCWLDCAPLAPGRGVARPAGCISGPMLPPLAA
jgi:hypothetical protein